jgi:hypothetical protein
MLLFWPIFNYHKQPILTRSSLRPSHQARDIVSTSRSQLRACILVSRSQILTLGEGESLVKCYTLSCPSASTNQIASLWHYVVCGDVSDCERKINRRVNSISSIHSRIRHRKLRNAIKMQSDWSHLIRGAGTTRCIALYQTLSLPRCKSLAARDYMYIGCMRLHQTFLHIMAPPQRRLVTIFAECAFNYHAS